MQHIPPSSLNHLPPRIAYLTSFLAFTPSDGATIHASAPILAPLIPSLLTAVYTNLLRYDITAKSFVPRRPDHAGPVPASPQDLSLEHQHILRQKDFLKGYLLRIVGTKEWGPEAKVWEFLDRVAVMHTGEAAVGRQSKGMEPLRVEYVHIGLLLGFLEDLVVKAVMGMEEVVLEERVKVVAAWNKLLWIQNDLFARRYVVDRETGSRPKDGPQSKKVGAGYLSLAATGTMGVLMGVAIARSYFL